MKKIITSTLSALLSLVILVSTSTGVLAAQQLPQGVSATFPFSASSHIIDVGGWYLSIEFGYGPNGNSKTFYRSNDLVNWTLVKAFTDREAGSIWYYPVGDSTVLIYGSYGISIPGEESETVFLRVSSDGTTTDLSSDENYPYPTFFMGKYVLLETDGFHLYDTFNDACARGTNYVKIALPEFAPHSIASIVNGTVFVYFSDKNSFGETTWGIASSTDLVSWTTSTDRFEAQQKYVIEYAAGVYYMTKYNYEAFNLIDRYLYSTNLTNWTEVSVPENTLQLTGAMDSIGSINAPMYLTESSYQMNGLAFSRLIKVNRETLETVFEFPSNTIGINIFSTDPYIAIHEGQNQYTIYRCSDF